MISVTADEMRKIDDIATDLFKIELEQMMELAGFHLAQLSKQILNNTLQGKKIIILSGKGNDSGGGLVCARHLNNQRAEIKIILPNKEGLNPTLKQRLKTLEYLNFEIFYYESENKLIKILSDSDLIIDALIGYSLHGNPKSPIAEIIKVVNNSGIPILSLDIPSGLDASNGKIYLPCIKASYTMTLALPKKGLLVKESTKNIGELYLADIGIPSDVYFHLGLKVRNIFEKGNLIKISSK